MYQVISNKQKTDLEVTLTHFSNLLLHEQTWLPHAVSAAPHRANNYIPGWAWRSGYVFCYSWWQRACVTAAFPCLT